MSTPSTATATLPHQSSHYGYSHHQSYQTGAPAYLSNNSLMNGTSRMATQYNYAAVPTLSTSTTGLPTYKSTSELATPQSHTSDLQGRNMPSDDGRTESTSARKRRRSKPTDWNDFYKNGLPKEVIVIDDSPEPQIRESPDPNVVAQLQYQNGRAVAANSRPAVKKRKRDAVYDPVHSAHAGPSNQSPHYVDSKTGSTISTDRTTSAINTTAATSLGSQYSNSNGSKGYAPDDTQPGKKRKRVTTRQQFAEEAKRREAEVNGDAFTNYQPPPRPPIKAAEVTVKVMHDPPHYKVQKIDDDDGHFIVVADTPLTERYQVLRLLGQGTFGKVVQARDRRRNGALVAIKIIRAVQKYRDASRIELRVLSTLKANDPENRNKCIHLRDCFDYRGHICIVMDLLGQSVFDFLKSNNFVPFPNSQIQSFARQLFTSVAFLHDLNLIHTDLKPENILLCDSIYQTFTYGRKIPSSSTTVSRQAVQRKVLLDTEIRLIDFGSATFQDEYHSSVVSTRHYRAPEIILGLGWSYPCDIWSIGCILVEFFTGDALFQTHDNLEHLAMMEAVVESKLDPHLIQQVNKLAQRGSTTSIAAQKYFKRAKLDYPQADTARTSKRFVKAMKKLSDIIPSNNSFGRNFLDLLKKIFVYDPAQRITAKQALQHPWFHEIAGPDDGTEAKKIGALRVKDIASRSPAPPRY